MTGLLVSVRNVEEAEAALLGGADLIDVKEPDNGALGAATIETTRAIFDFLDGRVPMSVACGELFAETSFCPAELPPVSFAKVGLAGCSSNPTWQEQLAAMWRQFDAATNRVAVAYADWRECGSVSPEAVLEVGAENGCGHLLLDTTDKSQSLLERVSPQELNHWCEKALQHGMRVVLAGSMKMEHLELVVRNWCPDFIAVRGAACHGERHTAISLDLVRALSQKLRELSATRSVS